VAYISILFVLLLFITFVRLIFEDFFYAIVEGFRNVKKFYVFYKTKKFDSFLAVLVVYLLNLIMISASLHVLVGFVNNDPPIDFHLKSFLNICLLLGVFFTLKNLLEFLFNFITGYQDTFRLFFLQSLFTQLLAAFLLLCVLVVCVYNGFYFNRYIASFLVVFALMYMVFNTIRSYQLITNVRINYKLHFFMYICAFRVLPLLILIKYILNNLV